MKYIQSFKEQQEMNEGFKNWFSTFLVLASLNLVPASIALGQDKRQQKEFVENMDQDKVDAALFVDYLNNLGYTKLRIDELFNDFKSKNKNVKSELKDVQKYVNKSGRNYIFNQTYVKNDYSDVDINKFKPDNYLTDMADMIEDSKEPEINNWISDYERESTAEICIITVKNLGDKDAADYGVEQGRRLGVGKRGADNGIVIVLSLEDRKWTIQTGYGMEVVLPDYTCSEIGQGMVPFFKKGDYYGGLMSALEEIKKTTGTNIEQKKEWIRKKKEADEKARREFLESFTNYALGTLLFLLVGGLLTYGYYKRKKKLAELKEMKDNIDSIISKIESLKGKLQKSSDLQLSGNLNKLYKSCKEYFDKVSVSKSYDKEFEIEIEDIYSQMNSLLVNYTTKVSEIKTFKSNVSKLNDVEITAYSSIKNAINSINKIKEYGYESKTLISSDEVRNLHDLIPQILLLIESDIDKAMQVYDAYMGGISSINYKTSKIASSLSSIETSIDNVKNWERSIDRLMNSYSSSDGSMIKLNQMISDFKSLLSKSKDWLMLDKELSKIINYMKGVISDYENEKRKRALRIEEDRERRRRESRSSYYSSPGSSSSSSSSFDGFGGGSFGGGGSSGSW